MYLQTDIQEPFSQKNFPRKKAVQNTKILTNSKPKELSIALKDNTKKRIHTFGQKVYKKFYPSITTSFHGKYDQSSCVLYTEDTEGNIISTGRMTFDSRLGLPNEKISPKYINEKRGKRKNILEVGEFVISHNNNHLLKIYYRAFYEIARENNIDYMVILVKKKDIPFHQKMIGTEILVEDTGCKYGGKYTFSFLSWSIKNTKSRFFRWAKVQPKNIPEKNNRYAISQWDQYARLHASIMTSQQLSLFREACSYLMGDVVDCGCGTAKLSPLLVDDSKISSYTGVDFSPEMVSIARYIVGKLPHKNFTIHQCKIEDTVGKFTSAVSIHSYYSWSNPLKILEAIYRLLISEGLFILATPNQEMDQSKLLYEAEKELIAHPDFEDFKAYNLSIESNPKANFIKMDTLIKQVHQVGFEVLKCHQEHYDSGVNFLVLRKGR